MSIHSSMSDLRLDSGQSHGYRISDEHGCNIRYATSLQEARGKAEVNIALVRDDGLTYGRWRRILRGNRFVYRKTR